MKPRPTASISSTTLTSNYLAEPDTSRQRQTKRDEAIRKKIEQELSKKKGGSNRMRQTKKIAGTVSALRPTQALTVKEGILVIEAAQLMAAKRSDCVLVVDDEDHLSGIFTAKDLAYRVVADNIDTRSITVADIMTKNPMCVTADTSAHDVLNLMVSRGFRHLPVCNEEGDIYGLLDITKCIYEALNKIEKAYGSSRKLYDALEGVEREWANTSVQFVQYMEALRDKMSCPDLTTVLDHAGPVQVGVKSQVREVAKLMRQYHTTAVLVVDHHNDLSGIFTSKDIVLRVIAAGLDPDNCSVVRVMTPRPDTALPSTSILDALKKMHDGHYLNLPVLDENRRIVGLIDVLRLTYSTLELINSIEGNQGDSSKFWNNISGDNAELESAISDSLSQAANSNMFHMSTPSMINQDNGTHSKMLSPVPGHAPTYTGLGYAEIVPGDSASAVHDDASSSSTQLPTGTFSFKFNYGNKTHRIRHDVSSYQSLKDVILQKIMVEHLSLSQSYVSIEPLNKQEDDWLSIAYLDDEDDQVLMTCDADLIDSVQLARKAGMDRVRLFVHDALAEQQQQKSNIPMPFSYVDIGSNMLNEGLPMESLTSSSVSTKVERHENNRNRRKSSHGHVNRTSSRNRSDSMSSTASEIIQSRVSSNSSKKGLHMSHVNDDSDNSSDSSSDDSDNENRERQAKKKKLRSSKRDIAKEYNLPIPNEVLLPAAITFLGVVIVSVFIISKLTSKARF